MKRVLLIDNFDSFTQMLGDYILQCGVECDIIRYDQFSLENVFDRSYDAYVISPGPGRPEDYPKLIALLKQNTKPLPVLGVCLGHQIIGYTYGASVKKARYPRHGKIHRILHEGDELFDGIPDVFHATRYHSLLVDDLPDTILSICQDGDECMGIRHAFLPYFGVQFHPESCMTEYGLLLIRNFIRRI